jgi:Flp pilus assembly protein TadG
MRKRWMREEAGQGMVELALALPVLFILVLGIIEFGRAWNAKQAVTHAAREGARMAVVQDPDITQDSVEAGIALALSRSAIPGVAVTIAFDKTPSPGGNWRNRGTMQSVYVGVQHRFGFFEPLFKALTGSETITIASLVSMRNE